MMQQMTFGRGSLVRVPHGRVQLVSQCTIFCINLHPFKCQNMLLFLYSTAVLFYDRGATQGSHVDSEIARGAALLLPIQTCLRSQRHNKRPSLKKILQALQNRGRGWAECWVGDPAGTCDIDKQLWDGGTELWTEVTVGDSVHNLRMGHPLHG